MDFEALYSWKIYACMCVYGTYYETKQLVKDGIAVRD